MKLIHLLCIGLCHWRCYCLFVLFAADYFLFIYSNELCIYAIFHWISSFKIYFECVKTYAFDSSLRVANPFASSLHPSLIAS